MNFLSLAGKCGEQIVFSPKGEIARFNWNGWNSSSDSLMIDVGFRIELLGDDVWSLDPGLPLLRHLTHKRSYVNG